MSPGTRTGCPTLAVPLGDIDAAGGKGSGGPLAVDAEVGCTALHEVALHLGDVVGHVVHLPDAHILPAPLEHLVERLPGPVGYALAVGPGEVGGASHRQEVAPPFG